MRPPPDHVPFRFAKQRAESLLDCLRNGKPIAPESAEGWTFYDMLATAGALILCAGTHARPDGGAYEVKDLFAAVALHLEMTESVLDGTYGADWEELVTAVVKGLGEGVSVTVLDGQKRKD